MAVDTAQNSTERDRQNGNAVFPDSGTPKENQRQICRRSLEEGLPSLIVCAADVPPQRISARTSLGTTWWLSAEKRYSRSECSGLLLAQGFVHAAYLNDRHLDQWPCGKVAKKLSGS